MKDEVRKVIKDIDLCFKSGNDIQPLPASRAAIRLREWELIRPILVKYCDEPL
jgi:hypothetical protein